MPKASFAAKDGYEPKGGFQEGFFEVVDAYTQVFQYPVSKKDGTQYPAFLAAVLMLMKTDEKGNQLPDQEEALEKVIRIEKDLAKMRPGNVTNGDDPEPDDLGDELDTKGNTIYCEEGAKINVNSGFLVFSKSLEEQGFKAEILGRGYMPDLIGLKAHAKTEKEEKRTIDGKDVEPTKFLVDRILVRPYETAKKPAGKASAGKAPAGVKGAAPSATAPKPVSKTAPAPVDNEEADTIATGLVIELSAELANETRTKNKFFTLAFSRLVKDTKRDKSNDKAIQELLKSNEWLELKAEELGFTFADDSLTFSQAA